MASAQGPISREAAYIIAAKNAEAVSRDGQSTACHEHIKVKRRGSVQVVSTNDVVSVCGVPRFNFACAPKNGRGCRP